MRLPLRLPALVVILMLLWVALWDEVTLANVVGGLLVGVLIVVVVPPEPHIRAGAHVHPLHALRYVILLAWNLVESNLRLAWEIATPGDGTRTGIIAVRMRGRSDLVVTLVANSITLTPGTLTVEVDRQGDDVTLYVHALYTQDTEAVRRDVLQLEARAMRAFGSDDEAARAARGVEEHDAREQARAAGEDR